MENLEHSQEEMHMDCINCTENTQPIGSTERCAFSNGEQCMKGFDEELDKEIKQTLKEKKKKAVEELPEDQKLIIVGTMNPKALAAVKKMAAKDNLRVVEMESKFFNDFLEFEKVNIDKPATSINEFLYDQQNRTVARDHAMQLESILAKRLPKAHKFFQRDVVKQTNLTHSKAKNLLDLIYAFGFIKYDGDKKTNACFTFEFNEIEIAKKRFSELYARTIEVVNSINRLRSDIVNDVNLNEQQKQMAVEDMIYKINSLSA